MLLQRYERKEKYEDGHQQGREEKPVVRVDSDRMGIGMTEQLLFSIPPQQWQSSSGLKSFHPLYVPVYNGTGQFSPKRNARCLSNRRVLHTDLLADPVELEIF